MQWKALQLLAAGASIPAIVAASPANATAVANKRSLNISLQAYTRDDCDFHEGDKVHGAGDVIGMPNGGAFTDCFQTFEKRSFALGHGCGGDYIILMYEHPDCKGSQFVGVVKEKEPHCFPVDLDGLTMNSARVACIPTAVDHRDLGGKSGGHGGHGGGPTCGRRGHGR